MDKQLILRRLARDIGTAAGAGDWDAVAVADAAIASAVSAMAAQGPWSDAERAALRALRDAHGAAYHQCSQAAAASGAHLSAMHANRDGWIAYALDSGADLDATGAAA